MATLPIGCTPHTQYLCFRSEKRLSGIEEARCSMVIDSWGGDGRWGSPSLGDGIYRGLCRIPGEGPWLISEYHKPLAQELVLLQVTSERHSMIYEIPRGLYLGFVEQDEWGQWRVKRDKERKPNFPEDRKFVRIMDGGDLLWLPLPVNDKERSDV